MSSAAGFDPFAMGRDRFATFARMRRAGGAVHAPPPYPELPGACYVFSHELASKALKHRSLLQAPPGSYEAVRERLTSNRAFNLLSRSLLLSDPPQHSRLRRPLAGGPMAPGDGAKISSELRAHAFALTRRAAVSGHFDAVRDLAVPLSFRLLDRVLGIPIKDPFALKLETGRIAPALDLRAGPVGEEPEAACLSLQGWVEDRIGRGEIRPDGMAASMLAEASSGRWSREEVVANLVFLLFAGQETIVDAFGNALLALHRFPKQRALLESGAVGWASAAGELLRFGSPVHFAGARIAAEDLEIGGVLVRAGEAVVPVLGSANRDEKIFPAGDALDLAQPADPSLVFGAGPHVCLGQHVARLELATLLEALFAEAPGWELDAGAVVVRRSIVFHGLAAAPVTVPAGHSRPALAAQSGSQP